MSLMLYTAWQHYKTARDLSQQQLIGLVWTIAAEQNQLITGTRQLLVRMSKLQAMQDPASAIQCHQFLEDLLGLYSLYTNFGVANAHGDVYCSGLTQQQLTNIKDRLYFKRTIKTHGFGMGEYQVGRVTGVPGLNFSYPFFDDQNRVKGAPVRVHYYR
jgi:hypothetical protein